MWTASLCLFIWCGLVGRFPKVTCLPLAALLEGLEKLAQRVMLDLFRIIFIREQES